MKFIILAGLVAVCFASPVPHRQPCGVPAIAPNISSNIVGGVEAVPYSWPWQAVLYKNGAFACGSTLVSKTWVMTAGHCVHDNLKASAYKIKLGVFDRRKDDEPGEVVAKVSEVQLHPKFYMFPKSGFGLKNLTYDVALLKLETPVTFTDHISTVCLPAKLGEDVPADDTVLWEVGWGNKEVGQAYTLRQVDVPVYNFPKCVKVYKDAGMDLYPEVHFCQGYEAGKKETCSGDSGGPSLLLDEKTGAYTQHGITSAGIGCGQPGKPALKSRVSAYIDFIEEHVKDL